MTGEKIVFDTEMLKIMSLFSNLTRASLKDCFFDREKLVFLVDDGELAKALGKNKMNVIKLEKMLNRKIKIVEFSPDKLIFIKNYLAPLKLVDIQSELVGEEEVVTITGPDTKTKGLMIGIKAQNLRNLERIVNKYFLIKEIKVV